LSSLDEDFGSENFSDFFSRERQSPKDIVNKSTTSSTSPPKKASSAAAEKATLNSNFDLLSLNTSIPTKSAASSTSPKPTSISDIPTPKATATIANDLLCLGGDNNQKDSEFDDFVKAATPSQSTTVTSTNGTPAMTTKDNSSNHFFDDFSDLGNASQSSTAAPEEKKTMSKDSIMALFNQKPSNPVPNPVNPLLQQQQQGFMPNNMGGMQIPANFGLGAQHPQNIQPQQPLVGGNGFGGGVNNLLNNPFLAMSQPTSDPNNVRKVSKKNP